MAGKTVEESRTAWIAHYDAQRKAKGKGKTASRVTIMPAGGSAFTVEGDSEVIAAYITTHTGPAAPRAEFAGLASDVFPAAASLESIKTLEFDFDTLLAFEEEIKVNTDRQNDTNLKQTGEIVLSSSTSPLERSPFYLDS
ncbi:hypothetical protein C0992_008185, partial [Termitomyces sp. T32_za158]